MPYKENNFKVPEGYIEIPGYEGRYAINQQGIIFSLMTGQEVKPDKNNYDYYRIVLTSKDLTKKRIFVHRLVAELFVPNPDKKPVVNHIDFNKANNSVHNLEWVTHSENSKHNWREGQQTITENFIQEKRRKIPKDQVSVLFKLWEKKELKVQELARQFNVSISAIYHAIYRSEAYQNLKGLL